MCVCVCVCERERERGREGAGGKRNYVSKQNAPHVDTLVPALKVHGCEVISDVRSFCM